MSEGSILERVDAKLGERLERRQRQEPTTHRLLLLRTSRAGAKGVLGPLNGFPVDG